MPDEWNDPSSSPIANSGQIYISIACFVLFRIVVTTIQHWPELRAWWHRRRHRHWLREAWRDR